MMRWRVELRERHAFEMHKIEVEALVPIAPIDPGELKSLGVVIARRITTSVSSVNPRGISACVPSYTRFRILRKYDEWKARKARGWDMKAYIHHTRQDTAVLVRNPLMQSLHSSLQGATRNFGIQSFKLQSGGEHRNWGRKRAMKVIKLHSGSVLA